GLLLLSLLVAGCSGDPETPEERIRAMIAAGESAVEERSLGDVKALISPGYRDVNHLDRRGVIRILAGYFLRNKSIHLLTQIDAIELPTPETARVRLYVAMAGQPVEGLQGLSNIRADLHRFDLDLKQEEGEWRVISGQWQRATKADFLN
ncbi:MAG: hypothetical protein GY934_15245, partial [Gammaproteobacteria bacterium]|nr:hypothetical protein [Gammaproteobacteria bacterium]